MRIFGRTPKSVHKSPLLFSFLVLLHMSMYLIRVHPGSRILLQAPLLASDKKGRKVYNKELEKSLPNVTNLRTQIASQHPLPESGIHICNGTISFPLKREGQNLRGFCRPFLWWKDQALISIYCPSLPIHLHTHPQGKHSACCTNKHDAFQKATAFLVCPLPKSLFCEA